MMTTAPALFVSHGAPTLIIEDSPAHHFIRQLGGRYPRPKAVVVASAHWLTRAPAISGAVQPGTIHDFGGFPEVLYRMQYPAHGAPELAEKIAALVPDMAVHPERGLDHGAWVPLKLMYPEADIPVLQVAIQPKATPAHHYELGQKLAALREEGVMILGSGSLTHNLYEIGNDSSQAVDAATAFANWMEERIGASDTESLLAYRERAPYAEFNHPTDEHLLPLFVALGAGSIKQAQTLHRSFEYEILAMDAYSF